MRPKLKSGQWGPFEIRTGAKRQGLEIDRKRSLLVENGASKLTVKSGHDLLFVEWEGGSEASTVESTRYDLRDVHPDWHSVTHYKARFDDGEALVAMIMAFNHDHNHTKEEKLFQRFRYSPDLFAVAMLAKATIAATKGSPKLADAIDLAAGRPEKKAKARLPEFVSRADFVGRYRAVQSQHAAEPL